MRAGLPVLVVLAVADAGLVATTTPFTSSADLVTAGPIIVGLVFVLLLWPWRALPSPRPPPSETAHPWRAWLVLCGAVVAWELAEYLARGSRGAHPTLSSMLTAIERYPALKALVFLLWLALGAAIVWSGRRRGRRAKPLPP
jgi:hypothetical protein